MGFQTVVNSQQAPAVEGDFASVNPRASVLSVEGGLVAGPGGVRVGRFGWVGADGRTVTNFATNSNGPDGFVHREQQGLITEYLEESSMLVPEGFQIVLHDEGEFFVKNRGPIASARGQQIFASYTDGTAYMGSAPAGAAATGSIGATFTATGAGTTLTASAVTAVISPGDTLGTTTGIPAGTTIVKQLTGTTGGAGTYQTSVATTISAATATSFGNVLNVTAVSSGVLAPGVALTGTGVPANTSIASQLTGPTGGVGLYTIDTTASAYAASTALTGVGGVVTNYISKSVNAVGELVKISTWGKQ